MAIFEHRPSRDSGRRRQADLSLHEDVDGGDDDLLDLPLDGTAGGQELRPTAAETVPISTLGEGAAPSTDDPGPFGATPLTAEEPVSGVGGWGPKVRAVQGPRPSSRGRSTGTAGRRHPETIGRSGRGGGWLWVLFLVVLPLAVAAGYFLNRDPAVAQLSTELVDFGTLRLGEVAQQAFEVSNQGQQVLDIEGFEVMGEAAAEFVVAGEDCVGRPLAQGEVCRVRLAFRPQDSGPRKARLALRSSAAGLRTLPLLGAGSSPRLDLTPPQLDFPQQIVGSVAAPQVVWLSNGGTAPLAVERVRLEGLAAADFVLRRDDCSGHQLPPGERCALRFVFVPTAVGERRARVVVVSDAAEGQGSELIGLGLPQEPEVRLSPQRLELAPTVLGAQSPALAIEIFNDGNGPLQVHDLRPRTDDEASSDAFRLIQENCTAGEIAAGSSCRLDILFQPNREGEVSAFFEILHSAGEGRHLVPLVGQGLAPHLSLEPRRLSFGEGAVGLPGSPLSLRFVSSGTAPLRVEEVRLDGADAAAFSVTPVACLEDDLEAGASCALEVRFQPRRDGPHRSELVIRHNADGGEERIPLNGLGTSPKLLVDAQRLDFGDVRVGESARRSLTLSNGGRAALEVRRLRLAGGRGSDVEVLEDRCSGRRLAAAARCTVELSFAPRQPGAFAASLRVEHNGSRETLEVPLRGVASAPPPPRLGSQPSQFDFAPLAPGGRGPIQTLQLRNAGQGRLVIAEVSLTGPHRDSFQIVPGTCAGSSGLDPREECTVGVRFAPQVDGVFEASLEVRHNGPEGVQRIPLRGQTPTP